MDQDQQRDAAEEAHNRALTRSEVDPDEPESETGARDVAERALALSRDLPQQAAWMTPATTTADLAAMVAQLAAAVTCYIEDNERQVTDHTQALTMDHGRIDSLERRVSAIEEEAENLNARDRLAALEDERSDEVETRSPEWQEAYDQGWTAALAARDAEDDHDSHDVYVTGCEACDDDRAEAPVLTDEAALARIASLCGLGWGRGSDLALIAEVVKATGRVIGEPR